ncbi:unnamed protein product, partial [Polarella glacialis]
SAGSAGDTKTCREALLSRLEKEASPAEIRRKKEEQLRQKREEEKQEEKEKRLSFERDWAARQKRNLERLKRQEAEKKSRWQAWDQSQDQRRPEVASSSIGSAASSQVGSLRMPEPLADGWACDTCTLMNLATSATCQACDSRRPKRSSASAVAPAIDAGCAVASDVAPETTRTMQKPPCYCGTCTLRNSASCSSCEACGNNNNSNTTTTNSGNAAPSVMVPEVHAQGLGDWLQRNRLEEYTGRLSALGFTVSDIEAMDMTDAEEMFRLVEVSLPHRIRFKQALGLKQMVVAAPSQLPDCPVCMAPAPEGSNMVAVTPCGHTFCQTHAALAMQLGSCHVCRVNPAGFQRIFL